MSLKYLRLLEQATLPLTVTDPDEVKQVEALRTALIIKATLRRDSESTPPHSAIVHDITSVGWHLLQRGAV